MNLLQEITFSYARVQLFEQQLIRLEIFGNILIGERESREMNDAIGVLSGGRESLILILADEITHFNKDAREFSASDEGLRYTLGDALVVKSTAQRIAANFYLEVNKPKKPSKIFNSEADAKKWLFSLANAYVPF